MKKSILLSLFIIFNYLTVNAQYTKLYDFSNAMNGWVPTGSLVSDGIFLYGMTQQGGTGLGTGRGVLFKIMPDGTGYSKLHDFTCNPDGCYPNGSLIYDGVFLYGATQYGGVGDNGTIFKIKPDGTGYSKLFDFTGLYGDNPTGVIMEGTFLYGMTNTDSITGGGNIYKIKSDGTGYSKLFDFTGANGFNPSGSLISDGTFLYGTTIQGGVNDSGIVFKIKLDGTGYSKLLDFNGINGKHPSNLIYDSTFLYGTTSSGGTNNMGVIFKIKTNGMGYSKLLDFAGITNGATPACTLFSDGTFLYGMTEQGGTDSLGTIFKIKSDGTEYFKLLDFTGIANGNSPQGPLISDGTFLYGMTVSGGITGMGTIFKLGLSTGITINNNSNEFNVFPNPTLGTFTIKTNENEYLLIISNIFGENIYQKRIRNQQSEIDLSQQATGIYFVNIKTEKETISKKLIIIK